MKLQQNKIRSTVSGLIHKPILNKVALSDFIYIYNPIVSRLVANVRTHL